MKRLWAGGAGLVCLLLVQGVFAATCAGLQVTASALNVRTGPGTGYAKVGVVYRHQIYVEVGTSGSWRKIWYDQRTGQKG